MVLRVNHWQGSVFPSFSISLLRGVRLFDCSELSQLCFKLVFVLSFSFSNFESKTLWLQWSVPILFAANLLQCWVMQGTEKVSLNIRWIRQRSNIRQIFRNIGQIFWNVSPIFWNIRQIFWNIRHAFWNIRQIFWNTRQLFWNIRQILQIYWLQWRVPILFAANFLQCWVM